MQYNIFKINKIPLLNGKKSIPKDKAPTTLAINNLFIFICLFKVISIVINSNKS